jgi:hypothetical protein
MINKPEHHSVRKILLPSGRTIEVVRFHDEETSPARGLHICLRCESELVQPLTWSEAGKGRWKLTLECPNCGWTETGTYGRDQVDRLEERLDDGLTVMLADLQRLAYANMAGDVSRFASALRSDLILPEDF